MRFLKSHDTEDPSNIACILHSETSTKTTPVMYEFYRQSLVGKALQDVIEEKVQSNKLTPMQAKYIMEKFDSVIPTIFNKTVQNNVNFKGVVKNYNFVDGVWKFVTSDFVMSINNELFRSRKLKIVACDADTSMEYSRRRRRRT